MQAIYLIQTSDIQSQQYRVVSVAEGGDGTVGVTAVAYNESIYAAVEQNIALTPRDISNLDLSRMRQKACLALSFYTKKVRRFTLVLI